MSWLKNLFTVQPRYKTGAVPNPFDPRDIPVTSFQPAGVTPPVFFTNISWMPVENQLNNGSCVGHAESLIVKYFDQVENKRILDVSPRFLYSACKKQDNYEGQGTYPRVAAKILKDLGCATEETVPNDNWLPHSEYINVSFTEDILEDAKPQKVKGYAFVPAAREALKSYLVQNKLMTLTLPVGDWSQPEVKPGNNGYHRILVYGYLDEGNDTRFFFRNSWGSHWGINGNGQFLFSDFQGKILDVHVYTDIPNEVLEEAKKKWTYKYFKPGERTGQYGTVADLKHELIGMLDEARGKAGIPFSITSGFRTPEQNRKVRGSTNSAHLRGWAADIRVRNSEERDKILVAAREVGFNRIGIGNGFVHLDADPSLPANRTWTYYD